MNFVAFLQQISISFGFIQCYKINRLVTLKDVKQVLHRATQLKVNPDHIINERSAVFQVAPSKTALTYRFN